MTAAATRSGVACVVFGIWLGTAAWTARVSAAAGAEPSGRIPEAAIEGVVLDVPYLAQDADLCAGAAAAMVLRYWGVPGVRDTDFRHLRGGPGRGIRAVDLVEELRRMGAQAWAYEGSDEDARAHLESGRPLIALLDEPGDVDHFVVLVAWAGGTVLFHDPVHGPYRSLAEAEWAKRWGAAGHATILVLPHGSPPRPSQGSEEARLSEVDRLDDARANRADSLGVAPANCSDSVGAALARVRAGDLEAADAFLRRSCDRCPKDPAPRRELAGVRFRQLRFAESQAWAESALALDVRDFHAWRTAAAARYLQGDLRGALNAWNHAGEPRIDRVRIDGAERTRPGVIRSLAGLTAGEVLTVESIERARRRLAAVPGATAESVTFAPLEDGSAEVRIAFHEPPGIRANPIGLARRAARAAIESTAGLHVAGPFGSGETFALTGRWARGIPRISGMLSAPLAFGLPGVVAAGASWERECWPHTDPSRRDPVQHERTRIESSASVWLSSKHRVAAAAGWDRLSGRGSSPSLRLETELRHEAGRAITASWTGSSGGPSPAYSAANVRGALRSGSTAGPWRLLARTSLEHAGRATPELLWPGAGTGRLRPALLRGHPLYDGEAVAGPAIGRTLLAGGAELQWWPGFAAPLPGLVRAGAAVFVDAAQAWRRAASARGGAGQIDAGAGLRIAAPGGSGRTGTVDVDLGFGCLDRAFAASIRWRPPWPGW